MCMHIILISICNTYFVGQIFVLPCRIPHSPQRFENTVGLVSNLMDCCTE